ncbi:MAG: hypothetical protein B6D55_02890 [Candidatus Omnitrophica bacterium 4484_70.2]|nr:MAG: hypothetical protein B6D55_02890 [Candidatus Omnitrophica bacterium 4484_70.2]
MEKFTFKIVDSPQLLEEVFKLRFQVYAQERHFIKEEDYPDGKEKDKFDAYSIHFVAIDDQGEIAGAVRLVLNSPLGFPLEEHSQGALFIKKDKLPRQNLAEISRLVISKNYRRRKGDGLYYSLPVEDDPSEGKFSRRTRPMVFGLYRLIYQESKRRGITFWYAAMEDVLYRLLKAHGFSFFPIGREIEYFGKVKPYLGIIEDIERNVQITRPDYYRYFTEGLEPHLLPTSDIL